jgi:LysR family transcriptional regulator, mexEF-oprN operon transcriptional activator
MNIDHGNLAKLDLNLLVAFDALITERSVTRAAIRLSIGQSAMSHNLARLRAVFDDDLFTRTADGMRPTPRAMALAEPLRGVLAQIQGSLLGREIFDPATSERIFQIGLPDSLEVALVPKLMAHFRQHAPHCRLQLRSTDRFEVLEELDADRLDVGLGVFPEGQTHHKRRKLFSDGYVCLFSTTQTGIEPPISLADYVRLPHVLTSLREDAHGFVDDALAAIGERRRIALTTPRFLAVPYVLLGAPLIATMRSRLARFFSSALDLTVSPVPVKLPVTDMSLLWHSSHDRDPDHQWLRQTIIATNSDWLMTSELEQGQRKQTQA